MLIDALSLVMHVCDGISKKNWRRSPHPGLSTMGIRKTGPGPFLPIDRRSRKTTSRWYSRTTLIAELMIENPTIRIAASTVNTVRNEDIPLPPQTDGSQPGLRTLPASRRGFLSATHAPGTRHLEKRTSQSRTAVRRGGGRERPTGAGGKFVSPSPAGKRA